jgi:hypothetical protein
VNGADATRIMLEVLNGKLQSDFDTPEQAVYRKQVKIEIDEIHAIGGVVEIPKEFL